MLPGWVQIIPHPVRAAAAIGVLVLAALAFWAGWSLASWRLAARIAQAEARLVEARAQAEAQARERSEAAAKATDRTLSEYLIRALDAERAQGRLKHEIQRLARRDRACLSAPVLGLLNATAQGAGGSPLPEPSGPPAPDAAATAADPGRSARAGDGAVSGAASEAAVAEWMARARVAHEACRAQIEALARWHGEARRTPEARP